LTTASRSIAAACSRAYFQVLYRLSSKRVARGVEIGLPPENAEGPKLEQALELIATHSPTDWARLRRRVRRILVFQHLDGQAEWHRSPRVVALAAAFLARPGIEPAHVAATLVHEATHAWLEGLGFEYVTGRRGRIEAICYRREAAFARRLAGGERLASYYDDLAQAALGSDQWSQSAFVERRKQTLVNAGLPKWLVSLLAWRSAPRAR
jgi:hypothetical protein